MSDSTQQLRTILRDQGHSMTKPRQTVFLALQHAEPQTMGQLVRACENTTDRASVYRTVALFEKLGVVQRLQIGWKYKLELSDTFSSHHHHVSCTGCGATVATHDDPELEQRIEALAHAQGFTMQGHQLEIHGLCSKCQHAR